MPDSVCNVCIRFQHNVHHTSKHLTYGVEMTKNIASLTTEMCKTPFCSNEKAIKMIDVGTKAACFYCRPYRGSTSNVQLGRNKHRRLRRHGLRGTQTCLCGPIKKRQLPWDEIAEPSGVQTNNFPGVVEPEARLRRRRQSRLSSWTGSP